jgi:hypothetical protein
LWRAGCRSSSRCRPRRATSSYRCQWSSRRRHRRASVATARLEERLISVAVSDLGQLACGAPPPAGCANVAGAGEVRAGAAPHGRPVVVDGTAILGCTCGSANTSSMCSTGPHGTTGEQLNRHRQAMPEGVSDAAGASRFRARLPVSARVAGDLRVDHRTEPAVTHGGHVDVPVAVGNVPIGTMVGCWLPTWRGRRLMSPVRPEVRVADHRLEKRRRTHCPTGDARSAANTPLR